MRVAALCRLIARLQTVCQVLSTFKTLDTSHAVPRRNIISSKSSTGSESIQKKKNNQIVYRMRVNTNVAKARCSGLISGWVGAALCLLLQGPERIFCIRAQRWVKSNLEQATAN